jgi:predicted nucleotidyltransferase
VEPVQPAMIIVGQADEVSIMAKNIILIHDEYTDRSYMKILNDQSFVDPKIRHAIDLYLTRIRERHPDQVEEVILYGSVARCENNADSDVDLLVIGKTDDMEVEFDIFGMSFDVLLETGIDISPKYRSQKKFEAYQHFSLNQNIIRDGIRVA